MKLAPNDLQRLLEEAKNAALKAGDLIRSKRGSNIEILHKADQASLAAQVVTEVDRECEALILEKLSETVVEYDLGLLTEEQEDDKTRLKKDYFWCIDPLDGTLAFTVDQAGYAISIALVSKQGKSVLGVVYDPVRKKLYDAAEGQGARVNSEEWKSPTTVKRNTFTLPCDDSLQKRTNYDRFIELVRNRCQTENQTLNLVLHGGAVMNVIRVLESGSGCYFKPTKTDLGGGCIWDVAATACIAQELEANLSGFNGRPLYLNDQNSIYMNTQGIMCSVDKKIEDSIRSCWLTSLSA